MHRHLDSVVVDREVPADDTEDLLLQRLDQIGLAKWVAIVFEQNPQPYARDGCRANSPRISIPSWAKCRDTSI
jgi:hypothetical protein